MIWKRQTENQSNEQLKALTSKLDDITFMVVKLNHLEMQALDSDDSSESIVYNRSKSSPTMYLTHETTQTSYQKFRKDSSVSSISVDESLMLSEATQTSQYPLKGGQSTIIKRREEAESSATSEVQLPLTATPSRISTSVISEKLSLRIIQMKEQLSELLNKSHDSRTLDTPIQRVTSEAKVQKEINFQVLSKPQLSQSESESVPTVTVFADSSSKESLPIIRILSKPREESSKSSISRGSEYSIQRHKSCTSNDPESPERKRKKRSKRDERSLPSIIEKYSSESIDSQRKALKATRSSFQQPLPSTASSSSLSSGVSNEQQFNKLDITHSHFQQSLPPSPTVSKAMETKWSPKTKQSSQSSVATRTRHDALTHRLVLTAITFLLLSLGTFVVWYA